MNTIDKLKASLSPYMDYCEGYGNSGSSGNSYILGLTLGVGITDKQFFHPGSNTLDEINAFDKAEVDGAYIGQLNMSNVSSFCGPQGMILGVDLFPSKDLFKNEVLQPVTYNSHTIHIYSANPIIEATQALFGTVYKRKFILKPGAHVPFACKAKYVYGKHNIYSAIGIGIPSNRDENACLLMEDVGTFGATIKNFGSKIYSQLAKSIIQVGLNQKVNYTKCLVAFKSASMNINEVGCALVSAPYFTIARNALPLDINKNVDYNLAEEMNLNDWIKYIK